MTILAPPGVVRPRLRPVQIQALEALAASYTMGRRRILIVLPTGAGKTVAFATAPRALRHYLGLRVRRMLVLAHRSELLAQAAQTCARMNPRARVGRLGTDDPGDVDVLVASVQTLSRPARLAAFARDHFDAIVIDEAHHAIADSGYARIVEYFRGFAADGPLVTGYTATPNRSDEQSLAPIFQTVAFARHLGDGMREGWLAPARYIPIRLDADLLTVDVSGDFNRDRLAALMDQPAVTCRMVGRYLAVRDELIRERGRAPRTIVFAVNREHAAHLIEAMRESSVDARYVGGDLSARVRRETIDAFARGEFEALVSVNLLLEGFDDAGVTVALDVKPTRSTVLATQEFGRAIRLHPDKTEAIYIQAVPEHAAEARMVTVPQIFNLDVEWNGETERVLGDGPIHTAGSRLDAAATAKQLVAAIAEPPIEWTAEDRRTAIQRALTADPDAVLELASRMPDEFRTSDFAWQSAGDASFRLSLGELGEVRVSPRNLIGQSEVTWQGPARPTVVVGTEATVEAARRSAERWVITTHPAEGRLYLKSHAERWLSLPATDAQKVRIRLLLPGLDATRVDRMRRGVASRIIGILQTGGAR